MNKILNINLGGLPFTIDYDAYDHLDKYLNTIRQHFSDSESCEEIMTDIEVRMGELFQENLKGTPIISTKELDEVIKIMGTPADFGADEEEYDHDYAEQKSDTETSSSWSESIKTGKRLFRDEDEKVIAGVCSGLSAYFGITDPVWLRIGFVLLTIAGVSPVLYILLWAIVPAAKSASDKLAMKGETINISNIAKTVEEEINELSKRINEFGKDFTNKKKDDGISAFGQSYDESHSRNRNILLKAFAALFSLIGKVFGSVAKLVKSIFRPIFKLVSGSISVALLLALVALMVGLTMSMPIITKTGPDSMFLSSLGGASLYLTLGIPIFLLLAAISKYTFGYKLKSNQARGLGIVWVGALILSAIAGTNMAKEYRVSESISHNMVHQPATDGIKINMVDNLAGLSNFSFGDLKFANGALSTDDIRIYLETSNDEKLHIESTYEAQGRDRKTAQKNAEMIKAEIQLNDDGTLEIPKRVLLPKGQKYRGQEVTYTIRIPEGMTVDFDKATQNRLRKVNWLDVKKYPRSAHKYQWIVQHDGLLSPSYNDMYLHKREIPVKQMKQLFLEGNFKVELAKSDNPSITVQGYKEYIDDMNVESINDIVTLTYEEYGELKLIINADQLEQLHLEGVENVHFNGFTQNYLAVYNKGNGDLTGTIEVNSLELNLDGRQDIELIGKGNTLALNLKGNPRINMDKYSVKNATVEGTHYTQGELSVTDKVKIDDNTLRYLKIKGSPEIQSYKTDKI